MSCAPLEGRSRRTWEKDEDVAWRPLHVALKDGLERRIDVVGHWFDSVEDLDGMLSSLDVQDRCPASSRNQHLARSLRGRGTHLSKKSLNLSASIVALMTIILSSVGGRTPSSTFDPTLTHCATLSLRRS